MDTSILNNKLTLKANNLSDSIFGEISILSRKYNSINLSQGFSEEDISDWLKDLFKEAIDLGHNQYAPYMGTSELINSIKNYNKKFYDVDIESAKITVTNGATEAIYLTIQALINPGDEVILIEPFYDSYKSSVLLAGGVPVSVSLKWPDFDFPLEDISKKINSKTKLVIYNNPHNPTGKIFKETVTKELIKLTKDQNIFLLSDEVYEFLNFDENKFHPILSLSNDNHIISISSASKTFDVTGWKVGWVIANEMVTNKIRLIHQYNTFCVNTPAQYAITRALNNLEDHLIDYKKRYQDKKDLLVEYLNKFSVEFFEPQGTYFLVLKLNDQINPKKLKAKEWVVNLIQTQKLALIPMETFYLDSNEGENLVRFCFAKKNQTIIDAMKLFSNLL